MDTSKLDPESRRQMEIIELRTAIEKLNKELSEQRTIILNAAKDFVKNSDRIKILEEARIRQIQFNTDVSNRLLKLESTHIPIKSIQIKPKFSWWK